MFSAADRRKDGRTDFIVANAVA